MFSAERMERRTGSEWLEPARKVVVGQEAIQYRTALRYCAAPAGSARATGPAACSELLSPTRYSLRSTAPHRRLAKGKRPRAEQRGLPVETPVYAELEQRAVCAQQVRTTRLVNAGASIIDCVPMQRTCPCRACFTTAAVSAAQYSSVTRHGPCLGRCTRWKGSKRPREAASRKAAAAFPWRGSPGPSLHRLEVGWVVSSDVH